ncbi:PopZ family protein [Mycoplana ramosa]|uniref:PopZ family protein n=1 Tax=Mycoplana ramosa TaxID=40837 RepID=A0ABW3YSV4_MYCRA
MAQPNVAREPSMDEILASIRRIIESNEPPLGPPPVLIQTADAEASSSGDSFDEETIVADFHAEEARRAAATNEIEVTATSPAQPEPRTPQPAMSLADVAARVRAASERGGMQPREDNVGRVELSVDTAPRQNTSPLTTARMMPSGTAGVRPQDAIAQEDFRPSGFDVADGADVAAAAPVSEVALTAASVSLVSPAVGAQVANSFGALAEAVEAGPRRSFDEIAEEMLRPMLQEWLDDNLPTLVERLVREEIARVARGPRR